VTGPLPAEIVTDMATNVNETGTAPDRYARPRTGHVSWSGNPDVDVIETVSQQQ
jgi:hypothetical protein